jgi:hypothetical protein
MSELPQAYGCELRKARKPHKCCECRGLISAGENYHYHHGVWDGNADSFKVCADCEALRVDADQGVIYAEDRTGFGCLCETIGELGGNGVALVRRYVENARKRGASVPKWLVARGGNG